MIFGLIYINKIKISSISFVLKSYIEMCLGRFCLLVRFHLSFAFIVFLSGATQAVLRDERLLIVLFFTSSLHEPESSLTSRGTVLHDIVIDGAAQNELVGTGDTCFARCERRRL